MCNAKVLTAIDRAGKKDGAQVLLLRIVDGSPPDPYSKIGGRPHVPPGEDAPGVEHADAGEFLAQVQLHSPPLPQEWANRVVLLFRKSNIEVVARLAGRAGSEVAGAEPTTSGGRGFEVLRLPPGKGAGSAEESEDGLPSPYDPASLCRRVPAIRKMLADYPDAAERLVPYILVPAIVTHEIATFHVCLMGNEPELIQGEHHATCPQCSQRSDFLFQLGDVLEIVGDAPVVYVYGCRQHPSELDAFVDCH